MSRLARLAWFWTAALLTVVLAGCVDVPGTGFDDPSQTPPDLAPREAIAGTVQGITDHGDRTTLAVDARILDCEAVDRRIVRTVETSRYDGDPAVDEVGTGDDVVLHLRKDPDAGSWTLAAIQTNVTAYRLGCGDRHRDDVLVRPHRGRMGFPANETRTVQVALANRQDGPLTVRFGNASMHDRDVLEPHAPPCSQPHRRPDGTRGDCADRPYGERLSASRLDCSVVFSKTEVEVPAGGTVDVGASVTCQEEISRDRARDVLLLGNGTFTDELGIDHRVPWDRVAVLGVFEDLHEARAG